MAVIYLENNFNLILDGIVYMITKLLQLSSDIIFL